MGAVWGNNLSGLLQSRSAVTHNWLNEDQTNLFVFLVNQKVVIFQCGSPAEKRQKVDK
jgi:hypothetical protein